MKLEVISKLASSNAHAMPLLFIHGAWHAAWCWNVHFLDFFAKNGFHAHALERYPNEVNRFGIPESAEI